MPRTAKGGLTLAEESPRSPAGRRLGLVVVIALVGVVGVAGYAGVDYLRGLTVAESCEVTAAGSTFQWAPDQSSNAAAITAIALKRDLPPRAATIAIATAMQESKVRNITYGDRDSLGLFQQRPSQGWGTPEQILNPEYSTNKFYDALVQVDGYTTMEITDAAQEVQRSAAGKAYAQHEAQARVTASALSGQTHAGVVCVLDDPQSPGNPQALADLVEQDFGIPAEVDGETVTVRTEDEDTAWAVGSWGVARATDTGAVRVVVGDREWRRSMDSSAREWGTTDAPVDGAAAVTIYLS